MAQKPQLPAPDFDDGEFIISQTAEDMSLQQADIDDQINGIMSEVGSDKNEVTFHFSVWRVLKDQAEKAFLFKGFLSDLPIMERLRDEFDGGKFYIQIYKNKKRYRQITVSVEAPKKPKEIPQAKNDTAEILRAIAEQQAASFNQLKDTLMQLVGKPSTPQPSQMEMMLSMVTMMKGMKELVSAQQPTENNTEKLMDMLLKGMELGRESSGGGGTNMMDLVKTALESPLLASVAQQSIQNVPRLPPRPPQNTPPVIASPNPTPENQSVQNEGNPVDVNQMAVKFYLDLLVTSAAQDSDPALYGDLVLDKIPEPVIKQYIMRDDLITELSKIDPRVSQHAEWFLELRDHIHEVLTAPPEPEDNGFNEHAPLHDLTNDPDGSGGDTPNA